MFQRYLSQLFPKEIQSKEFKVDVDLTQWGSPEAIASVTTVANVAMHSNISSTTTMKQRRRRKQNKNSDSLPKWMKTYFQFHAKKRQNLNETNWESQKYLILRCSEEDARCGGVPDRLKPLPFFLLLAARTKRIFLIRWTRPTRLEDFLLPNEIDWTVPPWMERKIEGHEVPRVFKFGADRLFNLRKSDTLMTVLEGRLQDILGGAEYYEKVVSDPNETYDTVYHHLFRALFRPIPPIQNMVQEKMTQDNLKSGEYSVAHYRAFYAIEDKKHQRRKAALTDLAINAVECASEFRPGGPVYFASDSSFAVATVEKYGMENNRSISVLKGPEPLHLDKEVSRPPSDFYSIFVDLLLMAEGRCVSYGQGGFGRFALLLSHNSTCTSRHIYKGIRANCSWTTQS